MKKINRSKKRISNLSSYEVKMRRSIAFYRPKITMYKICWKRKPPLIIVTTIATNI